MKSEIIINVTHDETRIAYLENGVLSDLKLDRSQSESLAGNIYKGKVQRVLQGMNSAFVEMGVDKAAFLYVTDFSIELDGVEEDEEDVEDKTKAPAKLEVAPPPVLEISPEDLLSSDEEESSEEEDENLNLSSVTENNSPAKTEKKPKKPPRKYKWAGRESISKYLKPGQEILVQVTRDPISTKGARITSHISLPGRYLVYMPTWNRIGVSKKISSYEERRRLRHQLKQMKPAQGGFIVRTAAEGLSEEKMKQDVDYLCGLWAEIEKKKKQVQAPSLIATDLKSSLKLLRDHYASDISKIWIDDEEEYKAVSQFVSKLMPELKDKLEFYKHAQPIFDYFGIESEINRALGKKIWLKSGGYLIIDQTEALCTIDVNTGRFTGKKDLEETILKINMEAIYEIAYQIKIRNLGGIIILDLIDMEKKSNREKVHQTLLEELKKDKSKTTVTKISDLGLIEMTRKRSQESLSHVLCDSCSYCDGKGFVKSSATLAYDLIRQIKKNILQNEKAKIKLELSPPLYQALHGPFKQAILNIEKKFNRKIDIKLKNELKREEFVLG